MRGFSLHCFLAHPDDVLPVGATTANAARRVAHRGGKGWVVEQVTATALDEVVESWYGLQAHPVDGAGGRGRGFGHGLASKLCRKARRGARNGRVLTVP